MRPEVDVLHAYANVFDASLEKETTLWMVSSAEARQRKYTPRRSERHILRIVTNDISTEQSLTQGALKSLHERAISQRKDERWTAWALAITALGGGVGAVITAQDAKTMVGGAVVGAAGGVWSLYLNSHPLEEAPLPEVPDLGPPIRVLSPST